VRVTEEGEGSAHILLSHPKNSPFLVHAVIVVRGVNGKCTHDIVQSLACIM
jgi:hypothetical protein